VLESVVIIRLSDISHHLNHCFVCIVKYKL